MLLAWAGIVSSGLGGSRADPAPCWIGEQTWLKCCGPGRSPGIYLQCWPDDAAHMYRRCCLGSPEDEPMDSDVASCAVDPASRLLTRFISHAELDGRKDCHSGVTCQAIPGAWIPKGILGPTCQDQEQRLPQQLSVELAEYVCSLQLPLAEDEWYDWEAYERARLRYRFGTAVRPHCTVPNWRLIQEEPLRLYSFLRQRGGVPLSRVLLNVGAGDASWDDPLAAILDNFPDEASPWRGVYFEAVPSNCRKAKAKLAAKGKVRLRCGYVTPAEAAEAICQELGPLQRGATACSGAEERTGAARQGRGKRIEVDAMNVDIDSYDCSVLREVLQVASPKLLVIETGHAVPPPIAVSAEFHPSFQQAEHHNVSSADAISGSTKRNEGFWAGCSLSAAIALLWPYGLGLYRYAMLNAMFVRTDVADAAGLASSSEAEVDASSVVSRGFGKQLQRYSPQWQPADEFECWRRSCGVNPWGNMMRLTAEGVHSHLLPHVYSKVQDVQPVHPVTVSVVAPPASQELPRPPDAPQAAKILATHNYDVQPPDA